MNKDKTLKSWKRYANVFFIGFNVAWLACMIYGLNNHTVLVLSLLIFTGFLAVYSRVALNFYK